MAENYSSMIKIMKEMARPALKLINAERPGFSKLGGLPNLPAGLDWPSWLGLPLSFIAQFDLAELEVSKTIPEFPAEGRLYFFYPGPWTGQWQQPFGNKPEDAGSAVVIYSRAEPGPLSQAPEELSRPGLFDEYETGIFSQRLLSAETIISWPAPNSLSCLIYERPGRTSDSGLFFPEMDPLLDEYLNHHREIFGSQPGRQHQMGGFPDPEQPGDMRLDCQLGLSGLKYGDQITTAQAEEIEQGLEDWQLLLQLDSDACEDLPDDGGSYMYWGNEGFMYFWIRKQDLMARDFSKVWAIMQWT